MISKYSKLSDARWTDNTGETKTKKRPRVNDPKRIGVISAQTYRAKKAPPPTLTLPPWEDKK